MCPTPHQDYSRTPLWRKLGIVAGARIHVAAAPPGFAQTLEALAPLPDGVRSLARPAADLDVAVLFATELRTLRHRFPTLRRAIATDGRLWVAWPTKASGVATDLTFASVQTTGLDAGLVDNKSASIDPVFQGLQFVIPLKDRA